MNTDDGIDIEINYYKDVCYGEGSQLCFLIKEKDDEVWTPIFENIQGFEYEWGYTYKLKVQKEKLDGPSIDGSTHAYKLVKVIEKVFVGESQDFTLELDEFLIRTENEKYQLLNEVNISFLNPSLQDEFLTKIREEGRLQVTFNVGKNNTIRLLKIASN